MPFNISGIFIEGAQNPLLAAFVFVVVLWFLTGIQPVFHAFGRFVGRYGRLILITSSLGILVAYLGVVVWYLFLPGFACELEPMMASLSWLVQKGEPLYHEFESAQRYSVLYGPTAFLTNGLFLWVLGPSLFTAKLPAVLAALAGFCFFYLALARVASWRMSLAFCALAALLYWQEGYFSYIARPDPYIVAAVCFGLVCAVRAGPVVGAAGIAAALGYCLNLKIHAGLFFLPILALFYTRTGWRAVLGILAGGLLLAILPFLFHSQLSARNYFTWLMEATRHGLDAGTFLRTLQLALFLSLPTLFFLLPGAKTRSVLGRHRLFALSLLLTAAPVLIIAAKPGAGLSHLMPMIPLVLFFAARLLTETRHEVTGWDQIFTRPRLGLALSICLVALFAGGINEYRCVRLIQFQNANGKEVVGDIQQILAAYPDHSIGMAYGGEGKGFQLTSFRPLLVFAGQPVLLDVIALMESEFAGRELPRETYEAMAAGQIGIWLVPKQRPPFEKRNWYPTQNQVFPADFRELFLANYGLRDQSRFFDLWFHRQIAPEVGAVLSGEPLVRQNP